MSTEYLQGSAFPDYLVPGLFLSVIIGGANLISALALWRASTRGPVLSFLTGLLLVSWVAIQTAIIGYRDLSQVIWWLTFTVVAVLGGILTVRSAPERVSRRSGE